MKLSKEEAVRNFRDHWNIVYQMIGENSEVFMDLDDLKAAALREQGLAEEGDMPADCWLCAYSEQYLPFLPDYCSYCPIQWESHSRAEFSNIPCLQSLYGVACEDFDEGNFESVRTLVAQIANLPKKET